MKNKIWTLVAIIIGFSIILLTIRTVRSVAANDSANLEMSVIVQKQTFKIGEVINLNVQLNNKGREKVSLLNTFNVGAGYLHIYISKQQNQFGKYSNPKWGIDDTFRGNIVLNPNESANEAISICWNNKPVTSDSLSPAINKKMMEGKILTDYAFSEPGIYYVKATYLINLMSQLKPILIESESIKITIEEPKGEDLEVWNKIKDNGNFAYFIQEGDMLIPSYKPEERAKFQAEVEQILTDYPNSFYAASLSQSLAKFKASEAKRCELMEKMKPNSMLKP
jgi:hypothetical protein